MPSSSMLSRNLSTFDLLDDSEKLKVVNKIYLILDQCLVQYICLYEIESGSTIQ